VTAPSAPRRGSFASITSAPPAAAAAASTASETLTSSSTAGSYTAARGVRRNWLALPLAAFLLIFQGLNDTQGSGLWIFAFAVLAAVLNVFIAVRFGLLTLVVARFVWHVLYGVPFTLDVSHWSAVPSNWSIVLLAALAMFAFYASRAGMPLFGRTRSA
jgi:hypothetical protein